MTPLDDDDDEQSGWPSTSQMTICWRACND